MQNQSERFLVGYVAKAQGIKGEIFVKLKAGVAEWLEQLKSVWLTSPEGDLLELTPTQVRPHKGGLIIKCEEISDRNRAEELQGYSMWIPTSFLVAPKGERIFLNEIADFRVEDENQEWLGDVVGFESNGPQDLLLIQHNKDRLTVPLVDEFLKKIDFEKKTLVMAIPAGLRNLHRQS